MTQSVAMGDLGGDDAQEFQVPRHWLDLGLIASCVEAKKHELASAGQARRLRLLETAPADLRALPPLPDLLFAPQPLITLDNSTLLASTHSAIASRSEPLWRQLLPVWMEAAGRSRNTAPSWREFDYGGLSLYTLNLDLASKIESATKRMQEVASARAPLFAHSANYMGSKAVLAGQIAEVLCAFEGSDTTVVDLMCGSGAMSGAFARTHATVASDAQAFSRLLAKVQGGGMSRARASAVAEQVMSGARARYRLVPPRLAQLIADETNFLRSELSSTVQRRLGEWVADRLDSWGRGAEASLASVSAAWANGEMLSHLYGGLYFGERQAYELDCLRAAIGGLPNAEDRDWALGALVCAASACAFTYGGHFAQPKIPTGNTDRLKALLHDLVQQRSLSVAHEFCARLEALGSESERVANEVKCVEGPWEPALARVHDSLRGPTCVYFDPPYTRDEYSRYYHVLESIVRYVPHAVSGKARIPSRGTEARFASEFSSRSSEVVEPHIARVIDTCLSRGWSCIWSYSSTGTGSVHRTLRSLRQPVHQLEVFRMDHAYRRHGRRPSPNLAADESGQAPGEGSGDTKTTGARRDIKRVQEFAVYLRPRP